MGARQIPLLHLLFKCLSISLLCFVSFVLSLIIFVIFFRLAILYWGFIVYMHFFYSIYRCTHANMQTHTTAALLSLVVSLHLLNVQCVLLLNAFSIRSPQNAVKFMSESLPHSQHIVPLHNHRINILIPQLPQLCACQYLSIQGPYIGTQRKFHYVYISNKT